MDWSSYLPIFLDSNTYSLTPINGDLPMSELPLNSFTTLLNATAHTYLSLIFLHDDTMAATVEEEAYTWAAFKADVGGTVGLWLGISVWGLKEWLGKVVAWLIKKMRGKKKH